MVDKKNTRKKYFVRMSQPSDLQNIIDFYKINKHKNVRERDAAILKERADNGAIVLIEDEQGKIVASSVSYTHKVEKDGVEKTMWVEIGSTRIAGLNGFPGVFDVMVTTQMFRAFLIEPPEDCFVGHMEHDFIQKTANRLGWRNVEPPEELQKSSNKTVSNGDMTDRTKDWFRLGLEGMPIMTKYMMKVMENPVLKHVKTGEEIEMHFSKSMIFNLFKDNIARFADMDFGSVDAPPPENNVRKHRDKWLKKHFR